MTSGPSENFWPERPPFFCRVCDSFVPKCRNNLEVNLLTVDVTAGQSLTQQRDTRLTPVKSQSSVRESRNESDGALHRPPTSQEQEVERGVSVTVSVSVKSHWSAHLAAGVTPVVPVAPSIQTLTSTFPSSLPSDHQGDVSAWRPPCDLQPGGGSGARDQHAGAVLRQAQPGRQLGVHPGGGEPRLRDDALLRAQGASPERRRGAARVLHHRLCQRDR